MRQGAAKKNDRVRFKHKGHDTLHGECVVVAENRWGKVELRDKNGVCVRTPERNLRKVES